MNGNKEFLLTQLYNMDLFSKVNYFVAQQREEPNGFCCNLKFKLSQKKGSLKIF